MPTEQTIDAEGTYIPFGDSAMRASHMVPEEVRKLLLQEAQQSTLLEQRPAIFVGTKYNPRRQQANGREQWHEDIYESLRVAGSRPQSSQHHHRLTTPSNSAFQLTTLSRSSSRTKRTSTTSRTLTCACGTSCATPSTYPVSSSPLTARTSARCS